MVNNFDFERLPVRIEYAADRSTDANWPHDEWRIELSNNSGCWSTSYKTGLAFRHRKFPEGFIPDRKLNPLCLAFKQQERNKKPVRPSVADVMRALCLDASAADVNFHEWCSDYGYSDDSIIALNLYKTCLEISTALHKYIPRELLNQVRRALEDM